MGELIWLYRGGESGHATRARFGSVILRWGVVLKFGIKLGWDFLCPSIAVTNSITCPHAFTILSHTVLRYRTASAQYRHRF